MRDCAVSCMNFSPFKFLHLRFVHVTQTRLFKTLCCESVVVPPAQLCTVDRLRYDKGRNIPSVVGKPLSPIIVAYFIEFVMETNIAFFNLAETSLLFNFNSHLPRKLNDDIFLKGVYQSFSVRLFYSARLQITDRGVKRVLSRAVKR